jgi:cold shock protein
MFYEGLAVFGPPSRDRSAFLRSIGISHTAANRRHSKKVRRMFTGKVKWFSQKRYGFITPDDGGRDVFVHSNDLPGGADSLPEGTRVSFEIEADRRDPTRSKAVAVTLLS